MLMGHKPTTCIDKMLVRLRKILGVTARLNPSFVLLPRILVAYAIAGLDYIFAVIPAQSAWLGQPQSLLKQILCRLVGLPKQVPNALLYTPLKAGGFGLEALYPHFQVKHTSTWLTNLNNRNALTRETCRYAWRLRSPPPIETWDVSTVQSWLATYEVTILIGELETAKIRPASTRIEVRR